MSRVARCAACPGTRRLPSCTRRDRFACTDASAALGTPRVALHVPITSHRVIAARVHGVRPARKNPIPTLVPGRGEHDRPSSFRALPRANTTSTLVARGLSSTVSERSAREGFLARPSTRTSSRGNAVGRQRSTADSVRSARRFVLYEASNLKPSYVRRHPTRSACSYREDMPSHRISCVDRPSLELAARLDAVLRRYEFRHGVHVTFDSGSRQCSQDAPFALLVHDQDGILPIDALEELRATVRRVGVRCLDGSAVDASFRRC